MMLRGEQMEYWDIFEQIKEAKTIEEARELAEKGLDRIRDNAL